MTKSWCLNNVADFRGQYRRAVNLFRGHNSRNGKNNTLSSFIHRQTRENRKGVAGKFCREPSGVNERAGF